MDLLVVLKKMAVKLDMSNNPLFKLDVDEQKQILESFPKPRDDIQRSYYQYKCQMKIRGDAQALFLNMISLPLLLFFFMKKYKKTNKKEIMSAVFMGEGRPENIIPKAVIDSFDSIELNPIYSMALHKEDKVFILGIIKRYPLSWHFLLKSIIKVARYRSIIDGYSPKTIIVAAEYSFTSSLLTYYCNTINNVKHINVQHGEKMFFIWDSFFRYNKMYVWDEYYKRLFISLKADEGQFEVELPKSIIFENNGTDNKEYDYCYYLTAEKKEELSRISELLLILKKQGNKVSVRPHPRYSDAKLVNSFFEQINIEDVNSVTIEESLLRTRNAISIFSTVLNQAYYNNINVVIDDISNKVYLKKLKLLGYICLDRKHCVLSELVGENENED